MEKQKWNELMTLADQHAKERTDDHIGTLAIDFAKQVLSGEHDIADLTEDFQGQVIGARSLTPVYKLNFMQRNGMIQR